MNKPLRLLLIVLTLFVTAMLVTRLSVLAPVGSNPQIQETSIACGRNLSDSPIPTRTHGLPLPYVTSYTGNPTCGFTSEIAPVRFTIDFVFWFLILLGFTEIIEVNRKKKGRQNHISA